MTNRTPQYISALSDLYDGFSALTQARTKASGLRAQARQAGMEASARAEAIANDGSFAEGQAVVNAGATGGGFRGSSLNVLRDMAAKISRNARQTIRNGQNDAAQLNYQAKAATQQGWLDFGASMLQAAGSLFG